MLKVIISLFVFMFSFNNQIFAVECDMTKFSEILQEVGATKFQNEATLEKLASYSVCGDPIKKIYEQLKNGWKAVVDLEKYEKKSGSKVAEKAVAEKAVPTSESSKKSDGNIIKKGVVSSVVKCPSFLNLPHKGIEGGRFINKNFEKRKMAEEKATKRYKSY